MYFSAKRPTRNDCHRAVVNVSVHSVNGSMPLGDKFGNLDLATKNKPNLNVVSPSAFLKHLVDSIAAIWLHCMLSFAVVKCEVRGMAVQAF